MNSPTIDHTSSSPHRAGTMPTRHASDRSAPESDSAHSPNEDLNRIRDILFGVQSREHTQRMVQLEEALARMATELTRDMTSRFQALEAALTKHVDTLGTAITREHEAREQAFATLGRTLTQLEATLTARASQLDEQATKESRDLRQCLSEQQTALLSEMKSKNDSLSQVMQHALDELRNEKVTRTVLADLFVKSAQSLSQQLAGSPEPQRP